MAKILIVDDDIDVLETGRVVLEREGHEVVLASTRAEGMQKVANEAPDLIILDVMMEVIDDGFVMARELRKQGNTVPIMMLTSVGTATGLKFRKDEVTIPVDEFQEKPLYPAELREKVAKLLAEKGSAAT